jgi:hypothetical protein
MLNLHQNHADVQPYGPGPIYGFVIWIVYVLDLDLLSLFD